MRDTVTIRVPRAFASLLEDLARFNGGSPAEQLVESSIIDLELNLSENRALAARHGMRGRGDDRGDLRALAGLESETQGH